MINYTKFTLGNGLRVLVHEDNSTPLVALNILYDVGSKDEDPEMTGLAHLFEHLMYGGSANIPEYDVPLQMAGGENNAFTNNDITNYWITIPSRNIETAFWLESDRMTALDLSEKNLRTQKNVVIEEFKQRYLNQPYGDAILQLRPLAYHVHPYRWPAIGKEITHIERIDIEKVKSFFFTHYAPNNAILALTGNINSESAFFLADKWFGQVERRSIRIRDLPWEPVQKEERYCTVEKDVPATALYKVWHSAPRKSTDFYTLDLITDLLSGGESGRLYTKLVRKEKLFSEINAFLTSEIDPGLIVIQGKLMQGISVEHAEESVNEVIRSLSEPEGIDDEMDKVKNKFESSTVFSNTNILNKAMSLSYYELLGEPDLINTETDQYGKITREMVAEATERYFVPSNCSTLYYKSNRNNK